jgi:hypothetical membrane protein
VVNPIRQAAVRVSTSAGDFRDNHPFVGPAVFISSALYFIVQLVVAWVFTPSYNLIHNTISDLGNTSCGTYGGVPLCSPRHLLMNITFCLLGVVMGVGSLLIYQEFTEHPKPQKIAARVGFSLMAVAGLGTIFVGAFPENTVSGMHILGAGLAIAGGNLCILILGVVLVLPDWLRRNMLFYSVIAGTAAVLFASHRYFGLGAGTTERIAAYPETLWLITFGLFISRNHYREAKPRTTDEHQGNPP